jgi:hypothetical protein
MTSHRALVFALTVTALVPAGLRAEADRFGIDDQLESTPQVTLADLPAYRAALSGRSISDSAPLGDGPTEVKFQELWNQPERFRGRRVTVRGRIQRIFRQGPVGQFPALAEIWISSPVGDPCCLIGPQINDTMASTTDTQAALTTGSPRALPEIGATVRFTGTFLKLVRYAASDVARLAPLIVGDRLPVLVGSPERSARGPTSGLGAAVARSYGGWYVGITLAALAAGAIARRLRWPARLASAQGRSGHTAERNLSDPPLEFVDPR